MYVDALKRRISASVDEENALKNIFGLKIDYVGKQVADKVYNLDGCLYKVVCMKYCDCWSYDNGVKFELNFAIVPQSVREAFTLTKTERKLLDAYERDVFEKFTKKPSKENSVLLDKLHRDFYWPLYNCKNCITPVKDFAWMYKLEEITCSTFATNGMIYENGKTLW